jgi:hypothetical protein
MQLASMVGRVLVPVQTLVPLPAWTPVFTDRFARVSLESMSFGALASAFFMPLG